MRLTQEGCKHKASGWRFFAIDEHEKSAEAERNDSQSDSLDTAKRNTRRAEPLTILLDLKLR